MGLIFVWNKCTEQKVWNRQAMSEPTRVTVPSCPIFRYVNLLDLVHQVEAKIRFLKKVQKPGFQAKFGL